MSASSPKQENLLLNLVFNIAAPWAVLSLLSKPERLGPVWGLVIALAFPLGYGVWDFLKRKHANFISIVGLVSVLVSGGLGLLRIDPFWFAVKDGAMPAIIGLAVLASMKTKQPLVKVLLYNEQVIDVARVDATLEERGNRPAFERLLTRSTYLLVASFLISAVLNFFLARHIIKSPTGTPEFNAELGRMHLVSLPVIVLPSMAMMMFALWWLLRGIKGLTGLDLDAIFKTPPEKPKAAGI
ncbi:MAG: MFS transporter [Verrucomicrobia bacterium]|nr:MFS transporter [Verrucomicrobiota bacterium]